MKFCIKLEHCYMETIQMIQKAVAVGNWWLASSSWTTYPLTSHAEFFVKHRITQVTQRLYSPCLATCDFWLFPKLKSPLNRKRFQTIDEFRENMMGQLMAIGRTVWKSQGAYFEGDWGVIVLCTVFLVSSSINVSFTYYMTWYFYKPYVTHRFYFWYYMWFVSFVLLFSHFLHCACIFL